MEDVDDLSDVVEGHEVGVVEVGVFGFGFGVVNGDVAQQAVEGGGVVDDVAVDGSFFYYGLHGACVSGDAGSHHVFDVEWRLSFFFFCKVESVAFFGEGGVACAVVFGDDAERCVAVVGHVAYGPACGVEEREVDAVVFVDVFYCGVEHHGAAVGVAEVAYYDVVEVVGGYFVGAEEAFGVDEVLVDYFAVEEVAVGGVVDAVDDYAHHVVDVGVAACYCFRGVFARGEEGGLDVFPEFVVAFDGFYFLAVEAFCYFCHHLEAGPLEDSVGDYGFGVVAKSLDGDAVGSELHFDVAVGPPAVGGGDFGVGGGVDSGAGHHHGGFLDVVPCEVGGQACAHDGEVAFVEQGLGAGLAQER